MAKSKVIKILIRSLYAVLILTTFMYIFTNIFFKNKLVKIFGFEFAIVQTTSMTPKIKRYDFVILTNNTKHIKRNDIVVFFDNSNTHKIIHRVVDINNFNGNFAYTTKGDNNPRIDNGYRYNSDIYARYLATLPFIGLFVTFLLSTLGIVTLVMNLILVIIIVFLWSFEKDDFPTNHSVF